ncbi:TATA-binding protein-associated factor BTAF1-like isoform X2 [Camellia sinensis]|uniref:TATA-binding protein-associated factor BTAF1-like isoform X2 n=1 Tax=Camellia sinensis TaxID=4442 RepID=UPI001036D8F7|nr:TATA-binding protein-associated factor BTAF1-like isoform X2 [Camellia sinensis]
MLVRQSKDPPSSLIVCPSTLVGHWVYEIEKFIDASLITTLQYAGSAQERILLRSQFDKHNVIITSYDVVRKDIDYLGQLFWNYCILDEGHIIKNSKSKITCAVKQLKAQHRLVLSGTPIQNNVLDLWSLFDFLMPGFLGTERQACFFPSVLCFYVVILNSKPLMENHCWQLGILNVQPRMLKQGHLPWKHYTSRSCLFSSAEQKMRSCLICQRKLFRIDIVT